MPKRRAKITVTAKNVTKSTQTKIKKVIEKAIERDLKLRGVAEIPTFLKLFLVRKPGKLGGR